MIHRKRRAGPGSSNHAAVEHQRRLEELSTWDHRLWFGVLTDAVGKNIYQDRVDRPQAWAYMSMSRPASTFPQARPIGTSKPSIPPPASAASILTGFLPPNTDGVEGLGFVTYTVRAKGGVQSGAVVNAQASIVFDQNEPLDTSTILNTVDAAAPTSTVSAFPQLPDPASQSSGPDRTTRAARALSATQSMPPRTAVPPSRG